VNKSGSATRPGGVTDAEYRALAQFRRALRAFLFFSESAARRAGLTPAQHHLLLAVRGSDDPGGPTIGDIADALKLRHHSAVELVNRAEAAGLLIRTTDDEDRRRLRLELTPLGQDRLDDLSAAHRDELPRLREETFSFLTDI
jgi:DNA-binding MarR family transcriptional regulator